MIKPKASLSGYVLFASLSTVLLAGCSGSNSSEPVSTEHTIIVDEMSNGDVTDANATTRVDFDINVPVYASTSLQVSLTWGDKALDARWVNDESWAISDNFPTNTENRLVVRFSDGNGTTTLGIFESDFKTGVAESELFTVTADQFDTDQFDNDGDGISNLAEAIQGSNPQLADVIEPVQASLALVPDKTFRITWQASSEATYFRVLENVDGTTGFEQIGEDISSSVQVFDHRVALYNRVNARYIVQACNASACADSEPVFVSGSLAGAVGYFKASNTVNSDQFGQSVALNANGTVLAVGAHQEDSGSAGINANQSDNSMQNSGAVYVFVQSNGLWQQQAYIKASNPGVDDLFGLTIDLSSDGATLVIGTGYEDSAATGSNGNQSDNRSMDSGAVYVFTNNNGTWQQQAYLKPSNTDSGDGFGNAFKLSGDGNTLVVGASEEDSAATGVNGNESDNRAPQSGAAYVFTRLNGLWQQQAYLKASNSTLQDKFGSAIGLSEDGNTLAVGAIGESSSATGIDGDQTDNDANNSGAVYLFERENGVWQQSTYLKASNTGRSDLFGSALSLSTNGETLAVTASFESSSAAGIDARQNDDSAMGAGAVYVFEKAADEWAQQAYIKSSNPAATDFFGVSVSLSGNGNTIVVGAHLEDSAARGIGGNQQDNGAGDSGAAYVFQRSNGVWMQQAYLKASNTEYNSWFGLATAISTDGETIAVGSRYENNLATGVNGDQNGGTYADSGAVYLY